MPLQAGTRLVTDRLGVPIDQVALSAALAQPWANVVLTGAVTPSQLISHASAISLGSTPTTSLNFQTSPSYRASIGWLGLNADGHRGTRVVLGEGVEPSDDDTSGAWVREMNEIQLNRVRSGSGFIAALDQSGGSTPKALESYGIGEDAYADDDEMFDRIHEMRRRIITSPVFDGGRILGAILFEDTMDRDIEGQGTAEYLWDAKQIVPFVKVDKGLANEADGVQVMKPMRELDTLLSRAVAKGVFGTKMRSVIKLGDASAVDAVVGQQFELAHQILAVGLVPIIEPEIDIHSPQKAKAEELLKMSILQHLGQLGPHRSVMLKLTLPELDDFYTDLVGHPNVLRVLALSGGYNRGEAIVRLARNHGVIASFSRALTEGLTVQQADATFDTDLDESINSIFQASIT